MTSFEKTLIQGQIGESKIATWFKSRGWNVLPVYEKEINDGKGPRLFLHNKKLIAPDMLIFNASQTMWIEAKHKTAFSWHRIRQCWTTGIDVRHYEDYLQVDALTPYEVWILFLHEGGQAKDSPVSPSGLYGNSIKKLKQLENHRSEKWGNGMVYWSIDSLIKLATLEEINKL